MTPCLTAETLALLALSEGTAGHVRRGMDERRSSRARARAERKRQKKHRR